MKGLVDLSPAHLAIVDRILAEHVPECEVRAFGSRATWHAKDYSDLDLAVVGDGPLPRRTLARLKGAFEESRLPIRVDVVDWHAIADGFREAIESDCVVVQEAAMDASWQPTTLGECAVLVRDTVSPADAGEVPYLGLEHIGEGTLSLIGAGVASEVTSAKSRFTSGDILFGKLRPYFRKVARPRFGGICSTDIWVVRPAEGVDAGHLFYVMASEAFVDAATRGSEGTKMPRAKWEFVSRYEFPLPSLDEQRAIARVLGALDDRIELNRRMSETLEEIARALFRSWFVDFDPVREKAEGRPSGLPPDLDALFPASFEASELGEIPAGWEVRALGEVVEVLTGGTPKRSEAEFWDGGIPWVSVADARSGTYVLRTAETISKAGLARSAAKLLPFESVVITARGTVGELALLSAPAAINQSCYALRDRGGCQLFLYRQLENLVATLRSSVHGTVFDTITIATFDQVKVIVPPRPVGDAFEARVRSLHDRLIESARGSDALAAQRDALLPRLVSGEVRVGGIPRSRSDPA